MVAPRSSSFPLQTGRVYHPALVCLRAHQRALRGPRKPRRDRVPHDQRETPYLDAALRYRAVGYTPFHTPGHKLGKGAPAGLREFVGDTGLSADLAMAGGVEDTRESTGLIRLAEDYAAQAWGSDRAWFLVNGSTSGIHALLLTLCGPGDTVIVPRNAHKSMLAGLIFTGAVPVYMEPVIDPVWGIPLQVRPADALAALRETQDARALFVTSPTYNGLGADLRGHRHAGARRRHPVRHRPGVGSAPALLQRTAGGRHDGRRGRGGGQHAQAHQRPHPVVGAPGARRARQSRAPGRHGPHDPEHQPAGAHLRQHRRRPAADGGARRRAVARRRRARVLGARAHHGAARSALSGRRGAGVRGRRRVRPHAAHHLRLRPRPERLSARDRAARRLPHRRGGRRPAQRRAQRHLRRQPRGPRAAGRRPARSRGAVRRRGRRGRRPPPAPASSPARRRSPVRSSPRATPCSRRPSPCPWRSAPGR